MFHYHHADCSCDGTTGENKLRLLWMVLVLLSIFSIAEFAVAFSSGSLALVADVGHVIADVLAISLALLATWLAQLPASRRATFGYRRVEILAALLNGLGLLVVSLLIIREAVHSFQSPPEEIASLPMLMTAIAGLGVNSLNAVLLHRESNHDLNLRGAFLHVIADAISSIGVILAAIAIGTLHWLWADGVVSLLVSGLILLGAVPLIAQSLRVLLEQPDDPQKVDQIQAYFESFAEVVVIENLRVWTLALGQDILVAHLSVKVKDVTERDRLLYEMQTTLQQKFGIQEVTLQMRAPLNQSVGLPQPELIELISLSSQPLQQNEG
jgi:cobalt-zinc-cadmium efflux system protein